MKFVNKQLAMILKEKGFDKFCFGWYYIKTPVGIKDGVLQLYESNRIGETYQHLLKMHINEYTSNLNFVNAPTINQVLEWLREKDIMVFPVYSKNTSRWYCEIVNANSLESYKLSISNSYEDACIAGIEYAIKNLINYEF